MSRKHYLYREKTQEPNACNVTKGICSLILEAAERTAKETPSCTRCLSSASQSSPPVHSFSSILSFPSTRILHNNWKRAFTHFSPTLDLSTVQPIHSSTQQSPGWDKEEEDTGFSMIFCRFPNPSPIHISNRFLLQQNNDLLLQSFQNGREFHLVLWISSQITASWSKGQLGNSRKP